ncbi:helix-turn-helix domain-containing protein [Cryobacterium sp. Y29]|uniref:helix-turn-helix domain-containing protein n=1 Tax=Cryobacterium sp. Y29 TaxID=2048285 RepID=UPI000CE4BD39|nr:helix-turn-helix transcriptional regulator [Cryobacterium sp. Y29]
MTGFVRQFGIGERIQAIRKRHGIRSAKDLADLMPGGNVTEAILQNLEAGRKQDLSVSQLLNISHALRVPPVFLLAPIGRPQDPLDLVNLSDTFEGMTVAEFDAWISGETDGAYRWRDLTERTERSQLEAMRELIASLRERRRLTINVAIEAELTPASEVTTEPPIWDTTREQLAEADRRIKQLSTFLADTGWDLEGWAP